MTGNTVTVPASPNGTVSVAPSSASKGTSVTITVIPNAGYELTGLTVTDVNSNLSCAMLMTMLARLNSVDTDGGAIWYEKGLN